MIDETVLEALLSDAGECIAIPAEGPERILAARDAASPATSGRGRVQTRSGVAGRKGRGDRAGRAGRVAAGARRHPVLSGLAAVVAIVVGLAGAGALSGGSGPASTASRSSTAGNGGATPATGAGPLQGSASAGMPGGSNANIIAGGQAVASPAAPPAAGALPNEVPSSLPTRVKQTGSINLQVKPKQLGSVLQTLTGQVGVWQGSIASLNQSTVPGAAPSFDITLRVPAGTFAAAVGFVQRLGQPTSTTTSSQDVTGQYVDLQARIQSLTDTRTQFEQILAKAQTIGDILSVEQQLSDLQTQVEQLQGQLQVLDNETTYSTLTVNAVEQGAKPAPAVSPPSGISKAWHHARHSFARGVESVISATGGIAVFLLFAALLLVLARMAWVVVRSRLV